MTSSDAAYILFSGDIPPSQSARIGAALATQAESTAKPSERPALDSTAAAMFPSEAPKAERQIDGNASTADKLFPDDAKPFDDQVARDFFSGFAGSAIADGDTDRAQALSAAGDAIVADAIKAGTEAGDLSDALNIVRERQGDLGVTDEKIAADFASGMETLQAEYGDNLDAGLNAARAMLRAIDKVAPGTLASLDRTGAGNDPRLIRLAIREAQRRGYP